MNAKAWSPVNESALVLSRGQTILLAVLGSALLAGCVVWPDTVLTGAVSGLVILYLATIVYYVAVTLRGLLRQDSGVLVNLDPAVWPTYTVLVPVYREQEVVPQLLAALNRLDYQRDRLDVIILVEEDDTETGTALARSQLPPFIRIVRVPSGQPRTKPRACNFGLAQSAGDLVVIYDAEDEPEPDQLKKAARAFAALGPEVACLQARLGCYNARHSMLTGVYATNYATWFAGMLPGLELSNAPVPLGGTSNHMRRAALEQVGGWDPWNVTEDCDLGIRLHRAGLRTRCLDSTTWEEATSGLGAYVRQRSRWVKGYLQTYFVHCRKGRVPRPPLGGLSSQFHIHMLLLVPLLTQLANPISWFLTASWLFGGRNLLGEVLSPTLTILAIASFLLGNLLALLLPMFACIRVGHPELARYALLQPLHWLLVSASAWRGTLQLMGNPFLWDKTSHSGRLSEDRDDSHTELEEEPLAIRSPAFGEAPAAQTQSRLQQDGIGHYSMNPWPIMVAFAGCAAGIAAGLAALFFVPAELRIRGGLADQWFPETTGLVQFMLTSPFHAPIPDLLAALLAVGYRLPGFLAAAFATGGLMGIAQVLACRLANIGPGRTMLLCLFPGLLLSTVCISANYGTAVLALHFLALGLICDRSRNWTLRACGTLPWLITAGCGPVGMLGVAMRLVVQVCIVSRAKSHRAHQHAILVVLTTIVLAWTSLWLGVNAIVFRNPLLAFDRVSLTPPTQTAQTAIDDLCRTTDSMRGDVFVAYGSWQWALPSRVRQRFQVTERLIAPALEPQGNAGATYVEPAPGNPLRNYSLSPASGTEMEFLFEKHAWRFYRQRQPPPKKPADPPRDLVASF